MQHNYLHTAPYRIVRQHTGRHTGIHYMILSFGSLDNRFAFWQGNSLRISTVRHDNAMEAFQAVQQYEASLYRADKTCI